MARAINDSNILIMLYLRRNLFACLKIYRGKISGNKKIARLFSISQVLNPRVCSASYVCLFFSVVSKSEAKIRLEKIQINKQKQ